MATDTDKNSAKINKHSPPSNVGYADEKIAMKWLLPVLLERHEAWHGRNVYFSGDYVDQEVASMHAPGNDLIQINVVL